MENLTPEEEKKNPETEVNEPSVEIDKDINIDEPSIETGKIDEPSSPHGMEVPPQKSSASHNIDSDEKIPILDLIYGVIFQPQKTFPLLRYYQPWGWALALLFFVNLITVLLAFLNFNTHDVFGSLNSKLAGVIGHAGASIGVYLSMFFYPLTIVFFTLHVSILHFLAEITGGRGPVLGLFSALAFIQILSIFSAVAKIFSNLNEIVVVFLPLGLAIGIWQLVLSVIAVREIYLVSTGKALLVMFLPLLVVLGIIIYMLVMGIAFLGPLLGTFRTYL